MRFRMLHLGGLLAFAIDPVVTADEADTFGLQMLAVSIAVWAVGVAVTKASGEISAGLFDPDFIFPGPLRDRWRPRDHRADRVPALEKNLTALHKQ